jgi:hypothetical protein
VASRGGRQLTRAFGRAILRQDIFSSSGRRSMEIAELARASLMAVASQTEQNGRDVHSMLLLIDVVTGETALQALPSENGPALCCCLGEFFRQFVMRNPELALKVRGEIDRALSSAAAGQAVH